METSINDNDCDEIIEPDILFDQIFFLIYDLERKLIQLKKTLIRR
jgi:hypothetical protein